MDKKEIRLNANKRKSLVKDYRRHCEEQNSHEKEEFLQSREVCNDTIKSTFALAKEVVERKYELDDVATLRSLQKKTNAQIRGSKGNKYYQSKKAVDYLGYWCSHGCREKWIDLNIETCVQSVGIIGKKTIPLEDAWYV